MFFSFLVYKTLRAAVRLFFSNFFQSFFFWWKMYSKRFNFLWIFFISSWFNATVMAYWKHLLYFFWWDLLFLFCFCPIRKNYIWSTSFKIYFTTFTISWMNTIKYEITTFQWLFQSNLIFFNKWFKKFCSNFICFMINYDFYVISFWMHYSPFIITIRRNKVNCYF